LIEMTKHEKLRVKIYDSLYELKDLKVRINDRAFRAPYPTNGSGGLIFDIQSRQIGSQILVSIFISLRFDYADARVLRRIAAGISRPVEVLARRPSGRNGETSDRAPKPIDRLRG